MANCGCKPCSSPLPSEKRKCKKFSLCVGNKSLHYDGDCLYVTDRKFQIPDGTYTSFTFQGGCVVGVGNAPLPVYTPQACCDGETVTNVVQTETITTSDETGNLAVIENNKLTVNPAWKNSTTVTVGGNGTTDKPWQAKARLAPKNNRLKDTTGGLKVELEFADSNTVKVTGDGSVIDPYQFNIGEITATLPEINKQEIEGNGFTVTKTGLFKTTEDLQLVTNLKFSSKAFTVMNTGLSTEVFVDEALLRTGAVSYETLVDNILKDETLVAKLKTALGL